MLSSLYPGFTDGLYQLGAVRNRAGRDVAFILADGKAYSVTGTVREPRDLGFDGYNQSRGLLEYHVRRCTQALPTVRFISDSLVEELLYDHERVQGVRYTRNGESQLCAAELVVDTGGQGAHHWSQLNGRSRLLWLLPHAYGFLLPPGEGQDEGNKK